MSTTFKNNMRDLMNLAWSLVKKNGLTMSEAMKKAWMNLKLKAQMKKCIVKFYFQKVDGTIREAYGTLKESLLPAISANDRKQNSTCQTYWDTEKEAWRCFKKANLVRIEMH